MSVAARATHIGKLALLAETDASKTSALEINQASWNWVRAMKMLTAGIAESGPFVCVYAYCIVCQVIEKR